MTEINFRLTEKEAKLAHKFMKEKELDYVGAIGGQFTFTFTRTSIGQIITIIDNASKEELTLTDFDEW